jgi:hypothetical protein
MTLGNLRVSSPPRAEQIYSTILVISLVFAAAGIGVARGQTVQPAVAVHDSELTRALESMAAVAPTPTGPGTTGKQWWPTDWHYFVMPESVKEALRSDGTAFAVVGDSNITAGALLTNGQPAFPILISLASEAIRDDEIGPLTNYVAAGGFLFVGSSAFTRNTNGASRGDFAIANQMGLHLLSSGLTNWAANNYFTKTNQSAHRLVSHIPDGQNTWRMPSSSEEIPWGISPSHPFLAPHDVWRVQASGATVLAQGDATPFLTVRAYGKGYLIYCAAFQPLIGHSGFAPSMYAYMILRRAIEWAFESAATPVPKLSPWPFQYDAAFMVRHDLENFTNEIAAVEASAQVEFTNGAKGDYFFCTGTLRDDASPAYNTNSLVAGLRRAATNYGAIIGPHNGGLRNPNNASLVRGQYDYWHWGPDEALDVTPAGYPSGKAYASASISNSFRDVESWMNGISNGVRGWVGCYFNATREDSYDLQSQLGVRIAGDQKLTPFPHWTLSTLTPGKRYSFLTEPVSDWFVGGLVAQSLEPWHPPGVQTSATLHQAIDFYYGMGFLINFYSHTLSTGLGDAGALTPDYVSYCSSTSAHPRMWAANSQLIYQWWLQRSNAQISATFATNGLQSITTFGISGASDPNTSVEVLLPGATQACTVAVVTNGSLAGTNTYRISGQSIKLLVGTTVTNAVISYYPVSAGSVVFTQNFDGVTVPALPSGWTTAASGAQTPWVTQNTVRDTAPNAAFSADPTTIGINELDSPVISIPAGSASAQLSFANSYDLETGPGTDGYDGGVLEIRIGTNAFTDILSAGGSFVSGGYNSVIDTGYSNPLAGRQAWSGNSGGFISTVVNLPAAVSGQTIQLRWRCGTDDSNGATGWRIDTIVLKASVCLCCSGNSTNTAPVLPAQNDRTVSELSTMVVTNTASDADVPANALAYSFISAPANATISSSGIITWTPTEGQGPGTNVFTTRVTDNGIPPLSATNSFKVVVTEVNSAPALPVQPDRTVTALTPLVVTNTASDSDIPANTLSYTLLNPPAGAGIDANGIITWTPPDAPGTTTNLVRTVVTDNGTPPLSATNSFNVIVLSASTPPAITSQPASRTNIAGTSATFSVGATGNTLSYQWFKGASSIGGATASVLTLPSVSDSDAAGYSAVVSNPYGSATSAVATLTVIDSPVILTQPASLTNVISTPAGFSVVATGTSLSYQWVRNLTNNLVNGGNISGATSSSLALASAGLTDAGSYSVVLANAAGSVTSSPAILTVIDTNTALFSDDFSHTGVLAPWIAQSGTWTVGGGMLSGTNSAQGYAFANITNIWTNYSVQARIRFSSTSGTGGGIGARLNPITGSHYAAWVYPENSAGGSSVLRLIKFQDYFGAWEYNNVTEQEMALVSLPGVGTNWHTLKLAVQGTQISAWYDGNQVAAATDVESNPYLTGSVAVGLYRDPTPYTLFVDDVTVIALPPVLTALNDLYFVNQGNTLNVPAPGILGNDLAVAKTNFTASLVSGPSRGALTFNSNGGFTYVPNGGVAGVDSFTYVANDGFSNSRPATVSIDVTPSTNIFYDDFTRSTTNSNPLAPWTVGLGEWSITNGTLLGTASLANDYSDCYIPANFTDFSIQAHFRLPSPSWACGLSARVNPATGARYVANVYPETSPLGPAPAIRLIKFHNWITWSPTFTAMALVPLQSVGTGTHTLKLTVQGNTIDVYYDGTLMVHTNDTGYDGIPAYTSGGAGAHMYMDAAFTATFDDVTVTPIASSNSPPVITAQPASSTNTAGTTATFTVGANGAPLAYQWQKGTAPISGATSSTLTLPYVSDADAAGYRAVVSNPFGSVTSAVATLTVVDPPAIVMQPASQTNNAGTTATFTVSASGNFLTYQWRKNGANLANGGNVSGATTPSLSLASLAVGDSGTYTVAITNSAGGVTSAPAVLTVVSTNPPGQLFADDFTRSSDPGPLTPWITQSGTWRISGGVLSATAGGQGYGNLYVTNSWSSYSVQAQVRFSSGAYGGGISGDLNSSSGARYAAWIFPEGSSGGANTLALFKFKNWKNYSYTNSTVPMARINLPSVGTNWHTLLLSLSAPQLSVSLDGAQMISMTDAEAVPYTSGSVGIDLRTLSRSETMFVDNLVVNSIGSVAAVATPIAEVPAPVIQGVTVDVPNNMAVITWTAVPGQSYRLQTKDDLSGADWTDVLPDILASDSTVTVTNNITAVPGRFYRVMLAR